MATDFVVVSQSPDVQVLGPTQVIDVQRVGFVTQPTGIYAEFPIPKASWYQGVVAALIGPIAGAIEGLISGGLAVGGSYVNDIDETGLLVDYIDFIVEYVPPDGLRPPMTTTVRVSMGALSAATDPFFARLAESPENLLAKAATALEQTAGL